MEAGINGNCLGELPPFPISTACPHVVASEDVPEFNFINTTFSVFGTTLTGKQLSCKWHPLLFSTPFPHAAPLGTHPPSTFVPVFSGPGGKRLSGTSHLLGKLADSGRGAGGTRPVSIEPSTSTLYTGMTSLLTGVAYSPMIMMAHRAPATPAPTAGTETGTGTGSPAPDSTGDQATAAPTSAAAALAPLWLSALGLAAGLAAVVAM